MGSKNLTYFKLNLCDWINGTIEKIHEPYAKKDWNKMWFKTHEELGGKIQNSGIKVCL